MGGTPRKTIEHYRALADKYGFAYLGDEPQSVNTPVLWSCSQNHQWKATYKNISHGTKCPYCVGRMKRTEADYANLAHKRGFTLVGPIPAKVHAKTEWSCGLHRWRASYISIDRGSGCPYCAGVGRITPDQYEALAKEIGYAFIGPIPKNVTTKAVWSCGSHMFETTYNKVKKGRRCPYCSGHAQKTAEDYHAAAARINCKWTGKQLPASVHTKTDWSCQNHTWQARLSSVQRGSGCPFCAGNKTKTQEDFTALAAELNLTWLGPVVKHSRIKTSWKCNMTGQVFEKSYSKLAFYALCPICEGYINGFRVSKPQKLLHEMLGGEMNHPLPPYSLDIAFLDEKICIEYDGYEWHKDRRDSDAVRDTYLIERGWRVLRVKSSRLLPSREDLVDALHLLETQSYAEIVLPDWKGE